ncbi:MAG: hypothetical protein RSF40_01430 [Oscillospiraceae bacterium]
MRISKQFEMSPQEAREFNKEKWGYETFHAFLAHSMVKQYTKQIADMSPSLLKVSHQYRLERDRYQKELDKWIEVTKQPWCV